jgi:hypothetical protein
MVFQILAQALTSASPQSVLTGAKVDLMQIGKTFDYNKIPESAVDQYIAWGDEQINAVLSEMYTTPLDEKVDFECNLLVDITEYNNYLTTSKPAPFNVLDLILLTDGTHEERNFIQEVLNQTERNLFEMVNAIGYAFEAVNTRVLRIKYPDPISLVATQISAAAIFDKYFAAQSAPNESKYGQFLRVQARQKMNDVMNGRTILHGQHRIGRRFYNANLADRYSLPGNWGELNVDDLPRT